MSEDQVRTTDPVDALRKVKEAEAAAALVVRNAREEEAVGILQEAQDESRNIRERLLSQAREEARVQRAERIRSAEAEAQSVREETDRLADELRRDAEPRIPKAVEQTAAMIAEHLKTALP